MFAYYLVLSINLVDLDLERMLVPAYHLVR